MRRAINTSIRLFAQAFDPPGPILELGSYYPAGHAALSDLRRHFPGREYVGCDLREGPGVDRVEDAEQLTFADRSVATVLMFELLEHVPHPQRAVSEARRVVRDDGLLALSVPFQHRLHGFPTDYWRFTASGIATLLEEFPQQTVFALGPRLKPAFVFAVAAPRATPGFADASERFAAAIRRAFARTRMRGMLSTLKERGRDFFGCLLGRAELGVTFFDPAQRGGYRDRLSSP